MKIKRNLLKQLKDHLVKKEISLIVGPRQAGKTTLMLFLKDYLEKRGEKTVFLNLDIERERQFFNSQEDLINKIKLEVGKSKAYVFIDEIQRKENAGLFLKGIYDMGLPYKFIVSGSGSLELKEKIHESLAGRKRVFELNTISFDEFVNFKTGYRYEESLADFFNVEKIKAANFLKEYLNFGGYPRIILEDTAHEKRRNMDEIFSSYLEKDISYLLRVAKIEAFSSLIKTLSAQAGQIVNMSSLSSALRISLSTVKDYLWYAEKTFIIKKILPYFVNKRKEITKSPTVYFYDIGLRNYSAGIFGNPEQTERDGFLFQNFIYNAFSQELSHTGASIRYWRTKDGAEVDFVIVFGKRLFPVEVKFRTMEKPVIKKSLKSFIDKYKPSKAMVINLSLSAKIKVNNTEVIFCSYAEMNRIG
ncbi:MAG: ATP-binding protein [Elusimicrobia bacterium]|nr:ATP-binding protein [Elusimicrobiota bacterium]